MKKISKLKSFFFLLQKNELFAIVGLFGIVALCLVCYDSSLWMKYSNLVAKNEKELGEQNSWLSREEEINKEFRSIIEKILHRDKIDQPKLIALVSNAAQRLSIKYTLDGMPREEAGKFFSFNKISINLSNVLFSDILEFDNAIEVNDSNLCIDNIELNLHGNSLSGKIGISALIIKSDGDVDKIVAQILKTHHFDEKLVKWTERSNLLE
ncbi:MAG: hypothetical protein LBI77_04000 [Puniceicoccales bacterium]|jgi:hypothetical protein|nr:hypothetical protein [Puniceicoccales bacterium]